MSHPSLSLSVLTWEEGLRELSGDCPSRDGSRSSLPSSQKTSVKCHCRLSLSPSPGRQGAWCIACRDPWQVCPLWTPQGGRRKCKKLPSPLSPAKGQPSSVPSPGSVTTTGTRSEVRGRGPCPLFPISFNVSLRTITRLTIPVPA